MKIIQSGVFHVQIDDNGSAEIFNYDGNVADVVVPDEINGCKVTKLGNKLFMRHEEIKSITLSATIETIGPLAFSGCTGLMKPIVLPESIREINSDVFTFYPLPEIELPPKLEIIQGGAFGRAKLAKIIIPASVREIGRGAFESTLIEDVQIPDRVEVLDGRAFDDCKNLRHILIGTGVRDGFKYRGFRGCPSLEEICVSSENEYLSDIDGILFDKKITRLIKYPAKRSDNTFFVPETVTEICDQAFEFSKVKKVVCPDGLKSVGYKAFSPSALQHINIPDSIEYFDTDERFRDESWYCLPAGITFKVSKNNSRYEVIDGKLSQKRAADAVGYTLPDMSEKKSGIFEYRLYMPYERFFEDKVTITKIGSSPENLVVPETLKGLTVCKLGKDSFSVFGARRYPKRIFLPKTIEEASTGANFNHCRNNLFEHIDVAEDNPNIFATDGVLFQRAASNFLINYIAPGGHGLALACYPAGRHSEAYNVPDGTEKIAEYAFYRVGYLKRVIIPSSVKVVVRGAFSHCLSLEEVLIEDGCEAYIWDGAFWENEKLTKIVIPASVTEISENAVRIHDPAFPPTIYGAKDSRAEYFAVRSKLKFVPISG